MPPPATAIFRAVLGDSFNALPDAVRSTHNATTPRTFKGRASVTRGAGVQARIAALLFGFPPSTDDVGVEVTKTPTRSGETWVRRFGTRTFKSHLRPTDQGPADQGMSERFGALTFDLDLHVADGWLQFPVKAGRIGMPAIPRILLPQSRASERSEDARFHFDVELRAPNVVGKTGGMLVHLSAGRLGTLCLRWANTTSGISVRRNQT